MGKGRSLCGAAFLVLKEGEMLDRRGADHAAGAGDQHGPGPWLLGHAGFLRCCFSLPLQVPGRSAMENVWAYLRQNKLRSGLGRLRRYCRGLHESLVFPRRRPEPHPVNRNSRMGVCQSLKGLVLIALLSDDPRSRYPNPSARDRGGRRNSRRPQRGRGVA
jgi:hypothetical protein